MSLHRNKTPAEALIMSAFCNRLHGVGSVETSIVGAALSCGVSYDRAGEVAWGEDWPAQKDAPRPCERCGRWRNCGPVLCAP